MNGSRGNMASGTPEKSGKRDRVMNLLTAQRMVPLVGHIIADVLIQQGNLERLQPEQDRLDRHKRHLVWPERRRRYQLREEIANAERDLEAHLVELRELGVSLLDPDTGRVGFPTVVNGQAAYFSWRPGEERIQSWHFVEDSKCRPIPPAWNKMSDISLTGSS
jgi:hypothetical protein